MTRRGWAVVAAIVLSVGLLAGVVLRDGARAAAPAAAVPATTALAPTRSAGPGPSAERDGMPAGFARSEAGARAAATAYASASQRWMYFDDASVKAAVTAIATKDAALRLTADVLDEVRTAREGLTGSTGRVWWIVRPLATHVETVRADTARVAVWVVSVLSASDVAMPQSDWRTVTVELRWEDGDWRVDGVRDSAGPTPMLGPRDRPWPPEQLDESLDGFERIDVGRP